MQIVNLNNGVEMPLLGFGTMMNPALTEQAVLDALEAGYRLIDTAALYKNEAEVGAALQKSGVPRKELFVTSKLWPQDYGYENAKKGFETALEKLGLDYLDLYLLHQPAGDYYGAWRALEELYEAGKIRAIGISNFTPERVVDLCLHNEIAPAVNQVEVHPYFHQADALPIMKEYGVQMEAWGPLGEGQKDIFHNELLAKIGAYHDKTVAQVILRWHLQRGIVAIPKSTHKERMVENINIFDFQLSDAEMREIAAMDVGHSEMSNPYSPEMAKILGTMTIHD